MTQVLAVAWRSVRSRPALFAGGFAALTLGVTVIAAAGLVIASGSAGAPQSRFGSNTVVVTASPMIRVREPAARPGGRSRFYTQVLAVPPALSLGEVARLGRLRGVARVIADRAQPRRTASVAAPVLLHWRPGQQVLAWLGDGTPVRLRVAAVFNAGLTGPGMLLPRSLAQAHMPPGTVTTAYLSLRPGASPAAVSKLDELLRGTGAAVLTRGSYLRQAKLGRAEGENIGLTATLAMALLYTAIAITNTLVMAVRERVRDLAQLRLAGATRRQALRTPAWEAAAIAALGVLLGLAVTAITIVAVPAALRRIGSAATVTVPWNPILAITGISLLLVLAPSVIASYLAVRPRPIEGLRIPE